MIIGGKGTLGEAGMKYNEDAFTNFNEKVLEPCHNCGRTFLPDSLKVHLRSCDKKYGKVAEGSQTQQ